LLRFLVSGSGLVVEPLGNLILFMCRPSRTLFLYFSDRGWSHRL